VRQTVQGKHQGAGGDLSIPFNHPAAEPPIPLNTRTNEPPSARQRPIIQYSLLPAIPFHVSAWYLLSYRRSSAALSAKRSESESAVLSCSNVSVCRIYLYTVSDSCSTVSGFPFTVRTTVFIARMVSVLT